MAKEDNKYNHAEKPMKFLLIIYDNLKSLLEKMRICYNNRKSS